MLVGGTFSLLEQLQQVLEPAIGAYDVASSQVFRQTPYHLDAQKLNREDVLLCDGEQKSNAPIAYLFSRYASRH